MSSTTLLVLLACHARKPDGTVADLPPGPILPATEATIYATGESSPRDPLVALVAADLPWEESLAGGAGALALSREAQPDLWQARWAAIRAGYPYPIRSVIVGEVVADQEPPGLAGELARAVRPGEQLGLARARIDETKDRWVAVIGHPQGRAASFDREYEVGGRLELASDDADAWALVTPSGEVHRGAPPLAMPLEADGEYWLELTRRGATVVSVPIYVGMAVPPTPVVPTPGDAVSSPSEAATLALDLLSEVREGFAMLPLADDDTLATLGEALLDDAREGRFDVASAVARLRGAGFVGGPVASVGCHAPTVAACLADIVGTVDGRAAILQPGLRVAGVAAEVRTDGIALVVGMASE